MANLRAFSEEGRRGAAFKHTPDAVPCTSAARLRRCFGWTQVSGKDLHSQWSRTPQRPSSFKAMGRVTKTDEYYAIVYEFIPKAEPGDHYDVMQPQLDLLWLAGFCFVSLRRENWEGGILLDMADIVPPRSPMWFEKVYERIVM